MSVVEGGWDCETSIRNELDERLPYKVDMPTHAYGGYRFSDEGNAITGACHAVL
jgi:hypothetical protein